MAEMFANWKSKEAGGLKIATFEYPLFTDASVSYSYSELGSPYSLWSTNATSTVRDAVLPAMYLRSTEYKLEDEPSPSDADPHLHHGGTLADEIAALLSLSGGVRVKAGGASRRFDDAEESPYGEIMHWDYRPLPSVVIRRHHDIILPTLSVRLDLNWQRHVLIPGQLSGDQCAALIKAARQYQDALWLAESEPSLAWLMLVSAIETAANHWRTGKSTPEERLRESYGKLAQILMDAGGDEHLKAVAKQVEPMLGATKKFRDFVLFYLPAPPEKRPDAALRVEWGKDHMKKTLNKIYGYRSQALHAGVPFPAPMCAPPQKAHSETWYAEKPILSLRSPVDGKIWTEDDAVMTLDVFQYIAQRVLTKWWKSMSPWGNVHPDNAADQRDDEYWSELDCA